MNDKNSRHFAALRVMQRYLDYSTLLLARHLSLMCLVLGPRTPKTRVIMMPTLSSLMAPQVVITTTCGAVSDDNVCTMTTRGFQSYFGSWGSLAMIYRKTSNIRCTLLGKKIVAHSDVVGASPVGAAPTTSSFSTQYLASMDWTKTTARRDNKHLKFGIWCALY